MSIFNRNKEEKNNEKENKSTKPKVNFFRKLLVALGLSAGVATLTTGCAQPKDTNTVKQESQINNESNFRNDIKVSSEALKNQQNVIDVQKQQEEAKEQEYENILQAGIDAYNQKFGKNVIASSIDYIYDSNAKQNNVYLWEYNNNNGEKVYVENNTISDVTTAGYYGLSVAEEIPDETVIAIDKTHHEVMYGMALDGDEMHDFVVSVYNGQSGQSINPGGTDTPQSSLTSADIYQTYGNSTIGQDEFKKELFEAVKYKNSKEISKDNKIEEGR